MSKYLPYGGFEWVNKKKLINFSKFDVDLISENSSDIYILQVDLEYPDELHILHNDYPLVDSVKKLLPNLGNKSKCVVYYSNLQLYLFKQPDWLKKYSDFNRDKRIKAANSSEKDLFELMINSVYDKTMENLRKMINVKLVNNAKDYKKYVSK